jgi:hypothetical protein
VHVADRAAAPFGMIQRRDRAQATGGTPVRSTTKAAAGGLVGLAWLFGSGIAHADTSQEKQACQLMDDPAGARSGYAPALTS